MKPFRAILAGIIVWIFIFITFSIMSSIPIIKDSEIQQNLIIYILLFPYVLFGIRFYYKKEQQTNGFIIGLIMAFTSIILDALITVPLVIIPHGGSYASFFSSPFLGVTFILFLGIVFFYWKLKVLPNNKHAN